MSTINIYLNSLKFIIIFSFSLLILFLYISLIIRKHFLSLSPSTLTYSTSNLQHPIGKNIKTVSAQPTTKYLHYSSAAWARVTGSGKGCVCVCVRRIVYVCLCV